MSGNGRVVLVCGGRNYRAPAHVWRVLDALHAEEPIGLIVNGGAHGADEWARTWATTRDVALATEPADWSLGRWAGPARNRRMLERHKPSMVIAFPGGTGTANMVLQARQAGVRVVEARP